MLGAVGIATGALPMLCLTGRTACGTGAGASPELAADQLTTPAVPASEPQLSATVPPAAGKLPSMTNNNVIANSFAQLKTDLKTKPAAEAKPATEVASVSADKSESTTELTSRVVRTITVRPDGTPIQPEVAMAWADIPGGRQSGATEAIDEATARAGSPPTPVPTPKAIVRPVQVAIVGPAANVEPVPAAAGPTASDKTGLWVVGGSGANVRANPSKGSGNVLFALRAGEKVTVVERKRGWMKITDDQGRSGWIYSDYLSKSAG